MGNNMTEAVFYGFQFSHHGYNAGFWPLARAMSTYAKVIDITPPFNSQLSGKWLSRVYTRWFPLAEYRMKDSLSGNHSCICHYFFPENSLIRGAKWKRSENKLVLTCHMPLQSEFFRERHIRHPGFVRGLQEADAVILMAPNELAEYRAEVPQAKVCFIPHGVETAFFDPGTVDEECQKNVFRVLTVGSYMRDYDVWSKIVSALASRRETVEFTVIANQHSIERARNGLSSSALTHVHFLQGVSDLALKQAYAQADLLLLPLEDAWANNAVLEAMSMGIPLLVTDLSAVRAYAGPEGGGAFYFSNDKPDDAVDKAVYLLNDQALRKQLKLVLRERACVEFDWCHIAGLHRDLYAKLRSE